jgi:Zn-dependent peptidase ImmA (M78 family)
VNRLRAYRDIEGISQHDLAAQLGVSTSLVSAIEGGRRALTVDLERLGYSPDRFDLPSMTEPLHRHRASTSATAKARAKELLRLAGEVFKALRNRTERTPPVTVEHLAPPRELAELEEFAIDARYVLGQEERGPIRNLTAAVERAGVCVIPIVGLNGIDGISSWVDEDTPVIGLSPAVPGDRFRFSMSHELAHLMHHTHRTELTEAEANRFAGALLIPRAEFDAAMPDRPQLRDFVNMKAAWGVSVAALVYRAHELGYIDDARYRALQIQMAKWQRSEPGTFAAAHGTLLARLVEIHGGTEAVAADLGVNRKHVGELLNWSHLRLA